MPVFWIGFNLVMLPATILTKRFGGFTMMAVAALAGIAATYYAGRATSLDALDRGAVPRRRRVGRDAHERLYRGDRARASGARRQRDRGALSMLAVAAFARISFAVFVVPTHPELKPHLPLVPAVAWAIALLVVLALAAGPGRRGRAGP